MQFVISHAIREEYSNNNNKNVSDSNVNFDNVIVLFRQQNYLGVLPFQAIFKVVTVLTTSYGPFLYTHITLETHKSLFWNIKRLLLK